MTTTVTDKSAELRKAEKRAASTRFRLEHPKEGTPRRQKSALRQMLLTQEAEVAELRVEVLREKLDGRLKEADELRRKVEASKAAA